MLRGLQGLRRLRLCDVRILAGKQRPRGHRQRACILPCPRGRVQQPERGRACGGTARGGRRGGRGRESRGRRRGIKGREGRSSWGEGATGMGWRQPTPCVADCSHLRERGCQNGGHLGKRACMQATEPLARGNDEGEEGKQHAHLSGCSRSMSLSQWLRIGCCKGCGGLEGGESKPAHTYTHTECVLDAVMGVRGLMAGKASLRVNGQSVYLPRCYRLGTYAATA